MAISFRIMATSKNNWSSKHMEDQFEDIPFNITPLNMFNVYVYISPLYLMFHLAFPS